MAEYIDRDAALALLTDDREVCADSKEELKYIREDIRFIQAADVRPVVLCKDCGHWNKENQHPSKWSRNSVAMCAWFSRNFGTIETSEGDWCSYGYRREES